MDPKGGDPKTMGEEAEKARLMESGFAPLEQESGKETFRSKWTCEWSCKDCLIWLFFTVTLAAAGCGLYEALTFHPEPFVRQRTAFVIVHEQEMLVVRKEGPGGNSEWGMPYVRDFKWKRSFMELEAAHLSADGTFTEFTFTLGKKKNADQELYTIFVVPAKSRQVKFSSDEFAEEDLSHEWLSMTDVMSSNKLDHVLKKLIKTESNRKKLAAAIKLTDLESLGLPFNHKVTKLGAGLFLRAEDDILLLRRNSSHHNATLSVPGGNVDLEDEHLRATAEREAVEEMGASPEYTFKGEIDTRRGKNDEKMFKMYLGIMPSELRYSFRPVLDHESLDWGWFPLKSLHERNDLHPTVQILVRDHGKKVKKIFES